MIPGIVTYINKNGNWGYIKGYDDEEYYFEFSSLSFNFNELYLDMEVTFDFAMNGKILYAWNIQKLV